MQRNSIQARGHETPAVGIDRLYKCSGAHYASRDKEILQTRGNVE